MSHRQSSKFKKGVFPLRVKKKKKRWIYGSILKISRCCFSETRGNLAFYVTALSRDIHLMFLSICLWCCCLKQKLRIVFYPRLILFPIILYFYFDGWQQLKHWACKVSYYKILKGRNLSLVNLFCRHQWYLARVCYYNAPNRKFAEVFCYKKKRTATVKNCFIQNHFNPKAQLIFTWTGNQFYQKYFVVVSQTGIR